MALVYDQSDFKSISFGELHSERVLQFDRWWRKASAGRRCPSRSDIDPASFKDILPYFVLADITHDPFEVRYRLSGTRIADYDEDLTGRRIDDLRHTSQADIDVLKKIYREVCISWLPAYMRGMTTSPRSVAPIVFEGAIWPLSSDGQTVDMCAAIQDMAP